jgi:hypothetical protein
MTDSIFEKRIENAARYLQFDANTRELTWSQASELFNSDEQLGLPELMVLIQPRFIREFGLDTKSVLGGDFVSRTSTGQRCRAKEIWGYDCPFPNTIIHIDHSFPRSRGGATHPLNAMYLCDEHNLPKSDDIHMFVWEGLPTKIDWVNPILERLIHAQLRATGEKVHFLEVKKRINV